MDLRQLEYFVRVAELGSFTRASLALDIAQPALSRQVRLLEVELRQTLLLRNGRGAIPTEAGRRLLEHARGILHQVARAREELGRTRGALAGRVALGLPPTLARVLAVPLMRAFRERLPEAQLSISEGLSTTMQEWLGHGRLDIALLYDAPHAEGIDLSPLVDEALLLVQARSPAPGAQGPGVRTATGAGADLAAGEDGRSAEAGSGDGPPVRLRELADLPLVIPSRPNALRMRVEAALAALGCRPTVALEIDGVAAILDLVADGAGSAVLSRHAVASSVRPAAYVCRPIVEPVLSARVSLATSALRPATRTQAATLALIRELVARQGLGTPVGPGDVAASPAA